MPDKPPPHATMARRVAVTALPGRVRAALQRARAAVPQSTSMYLMVAVTILNLVVWWPSAPDIWARLWAPSNRAAQHEKAACKHLVDTLLTTKDQVEVQRIGVILQHVRCPILARLPE
jgi:hypothetical protein